MQQKNTTRNEYVSNLSIRNRSWTTPANSAIGVGDLPANLSEEVASVLSGRGIDNLEEYLSPSFRGAMPDPYTLKGMEEAVGRITKAIYEDEEVALYGDYDVDGATSTAILIRHLRMLTGKETFYYIPDRLKEGYGPNSKAMETIAQRGTNLLIILDSGTTAFGPIERAVELGMDVIVIDHHQSESKLPQATVVNPKRQDEDGSLSYLCTAGLAFLCSVGLQRNLREKGFFSDNPEPDIRQLLGIVALGTVADMVPLVGLNRAYVRIGLPLMSVIPGIEALRQHNDLHDNPFSVYSCGFIFGPCINASGRIDDTMTGAALLATDDVAEADRIAQSLVSINQERKALQQKMVDQALERVSDEDQKSGIVILYDENWHPGIIGLVASRIKDALDVSAVVIGTGGKGSARSIDGIDIGQAIIDARLAGFLISGGGHTAAGGLTVDPAKLGEFREFMRMRVQGHERPPLKIDLISECGSLSVSKAKEFDVMEPFGLGNPSPRVAITKGILASTRVLKGRHIKGTLKSNGGDCDFILFNGMNSPLGESLIAAQGHYVDICGKVKVNEYGGRSSVQLHPEDAMIGDAADAISSEAA